MLIYELAFVLFAAGIDKGGNFMSIFNNELNSIMEIFTNLEDKEVKNYIDILLSKIKKAG